MKIFSVCVCVCVLVTQLCLTLWDTMECSSTVSFVHGILQARILEWVAIPFSRDLPDLGIYPGYPALQADSLLSEPPSHQSVQIQVKYKLRYKIRAIVCEINLGLKFRHILVEKI